MLLSIVAVAFMLQAEQAPATVNLDTAFQNLKTAEEQKDSDATKKWAVETINLARAVIKAPEKEPGAQTDAESIKGRVEFAKSSGTYAEYALCTMALKEEDHAKLIDLYETLDKAAPDSKYLPDLYSSYATALEDSKPGKGFPFAEKVIGKASSNEDLLAILADGYMTRKQWEKAATYGNKLASVVTTKAKPQGVSAEDWDKRKNALAARGYYIAGLSYTTEQKFIQGDRALRAALPLVKGDNTLNGGTLYYLAIANYNIARPMNDLGRKKEALAFAKQAEAIPGQFQDPAKQYAYAISQELGPRK
ncbi:MAG TPA: hypothetical protein VKU01_01240 [Bryobacteraceae bacterium]|nr:hypothetical protein [Bryobacteraceae bacterium]